MNTARLTNPLAVLLFAVGLAYASAVHCGFAFDDNFWIPNNQTLGNDSWKYIRDAGTRGLAVATIVLNYKLGGLNPLGYHLFNVAIHAAAVLALFALLRRVLAQPRFSARFGASRGETIALAVSLLWAVHPLNTQAVTYVIQRMESLMGLFFLLTFYCWTRAATGNSPRVWYPLAVLSYLACCHCKEVCVALPPVLLTYDRAILADRWRTVLRRWPAYLGVLAVWAYILRPIFGTAAETGAEGGVGFGLSITPFQYLLTQSEVILHYLRLSVIPLGQSADSVDWPLATSVSQVAPALAAVALLFLAGAVLLYLRPAVGFLFAWFFLILGPTSSVVPIRDVMFEHRMYLSLIAVLLGGVLLVDALLARIRFRYSFGRPMAAGLLLVAAAVPLTWLTSRRNAVYRNNDTFLEAALEARPNNLRTKGAVAEIRITAGQYDEAERLLQEIVAIDPTTLTAQLALGRLYSERGQYENAIRFYRNLTVGQSAFLTQRGLLPLVQNELMAGQYEAARADVRQLVDLLPRNGQHRLMLAACELALGHRDSARTATMDAVELDAVAPEAFASAARSAALNRHPIPEGQRGLWLAAYWKVAAANLATSDRNPEWLDTQAQLAARLGLFAEAIAAVEKGMAAAAEQPVWQAAHRDRLALYRANTVYGPKD